MNPKMLPNMNSKTNQATNLKTNLKTHIKPNRRPILNESAVTSVVGEMLLLVLVIILVSIMAASALSMLPGEREIMTDISMSTNGTHIFFWHHGGDWIDAGDLTVRIMKSDGSGSIAPIDSNSGLKVNAYSAVTGDYTLKSDTFDLGTRIEAKIPTAVSTGTRYDIRLTSGKSVITAYDGVTLK